MLSADKDLFDVCILLQVSYLYEEKIRENRRRACRDQKVQGIRESNQ